MSRLPHENRNVVDRPDLPEYELNTACCVPGCNYIREHGGGHHLWPRSFQTKSWWVELWDGTVVGNRVGLCFKHHNMVTENRARIVYEDGIFRWLYDGELSAGQRLDWQPPLWLEDGVEYAEAKPIPNTWVYSEEEATPLIVAPAPQEGEECGLCKRRVPHKKKATSPTTKVYSTRIPIDDVETFKELVQAAADHHDLLPKKHYEYWTLLYGLIALMQLQRGELPVG